MIDKQLENIQKGLRNKSTIEQLDNTLITLNTLIDGKTILSKEQKRLDNIIDSIFERKEVILKRSKEIQSTIIENLSLKTSKGEEVVQEYLIRNNIAFIREQEFDGLINRKTGYRLRFDFYLPDLRACIEFDGKQHTEYIEDFDKGDKNKVVQRIFRDGLKDKYCKQKGILLLRISYKEFNSISKILNGFINRYSLKPMKSNWYKNGR